MTSSLDGLPLGWLVAVLFGIVFCRAQATYWLARWARSGLSRRRGGRRVVGPATARATRLMARWGLLAVTFSFLTIGLQTAVNAAAGASRVRWPSYLLAMLPGCLIWAALYATVGLGAFWAFVGGAAGSPLGLVVSCGLVIGGAVAWWAARRRRRRAREVM